MVVKGLQLSYWPKFPASDLLQSLDHAVLACTQNVNFFSESHVNSGIMNHRTIYSK